MKESTHPHLDMLAGYSLGALEAIEHRSVVAHLEECPECQVIVADYEKITDGLGHLVSPVRAPDNLRTRLARTVAPRPSRPTIWSRLTNIRLPSFAIAMGLILVLFNVSFFLEFRTYVERQQDLVDQAQADRTALGLSVYPTVRSVIVRGEGGYGTFVYEPYLEVAVLYAWGLEPLPQDQTYQAWLIEPDGQRISAGVFQAGSEVQFVRLIITSPLPVGEYTKLGVTVEPAAGSLLPTGLQVLAADLKTQENEYPRP
jgi:anti-sigma-K factor RskA